MESQNLESEKALEIIQFSLLVLNLGFKEVRILFHDRAVCDREEEYGKMWKPRLLSVITYVSYMPFCTYPQISPCWL